MYFTFDDNPLEDSTLTEFPNLEALQGFLLIQKVPENLYPAEVRQGDDKDDDEEEAEADGITETGENGRIMRRILRNREGTHPPLLLFPRD